MQITSNMRILVIILILSSGLNHLFPQEEIILSSPDQYIVYNFKTLNGIPEYKVSYKGNQLINYSSLSLSFLNESVLGKQFKAGKRTYNEGEDNYTLVVGKTKEVHDNYKEVIIPLYEDGKMQRLINIRVKGYSMKD